MCNEVVALNHRHQLDDGCRYTSNLDLFKLVLRPILLEDRVGTIAPVSEAIIIKHATSSKRKLLEQAQTSLQGKPVNVNDARVRMFLKDDKYHVPKISAPRCIQYRSKRYCLPLACYLKPIEDYVYSWLDSSGTSVFAKCRNLQQRGQDIQAKWHHFNNPVAISMDHSKFDCHVNKHLLAMEHAFYSALQPSPLLRKLLKWQCVNRGRTKNGTRYVTHYTRMSGDQNTGLGNSIINFAMTKYLLDNLNIKYCLYIDGDDFLVFVDDCNSKLINPSAYIQFGIKTKLDSCVDQIEKIEFCQTRPVFNGQGYTMVRNPVRMLERIQWGVGKFNKRYVNNYLTSVGHCCMSIGMGLPVEQYIGSKLANLGGKIVRTPLTYCANRMPMRPGRAYIVEPSMNVRLSYELAWGISPREQLILENSCISTALNLSPTALPQYGEETNTAKEGCNVPFWSLTACGAT